MVKYIVCGFDESGEPNLYDVRRVYDFEEHAQRYISVHHDCTYIDLYFRRRADFGAFMG